MKIENGKLINYFLNNFKISNIKNINHFLNFFYDEIQESIQNTNNIIDNDLIKSDIILPKDYNIIQNTSFISNDIKDFIVKNTKFYYSFHFKIKSTNITINIANYDEKNVDEMHNLLYSILCWLYIGIKHKTKECSKYLKIYLFLTDFEKNINNCNILGPNNSNSGFTYACAVDNTICIFRKEEILKVLIHETFHALGLDFSHKNVNAKREMLNIYNIKSSFKISETYSELWATIINSLFFVYFKLKKQKKSVFFKKSISLLNLETAFSIYQSTKILKNMKLNYNLILKENKFECKYKEKTNIFYYYILKYIFFIILQKFLKMCKNHNYLNIKNENDFIKLIIEMHNNDNKNNTINLYNYFENKQVNYNDSLKMTILE